MYLSATVLAMILVSCHAFAPGKLESLDVNEVDPQGLTYDLTKLLEQVKVSLKKGNAKLGIPVLDPLQLDHQDVNVKNSIIELEGALNNLRMHHLADYNVNKGEFNIIGLKASVDITWNEIDLMTLYKVTQGKLIDALSFYGDGSIIAVIKNLQVSVNAGLTSKDDGHLSVKDLTLGFHLKEFNFKISGLYNDDDVSKILSQVITELVPGMIDDYQQQLSKLGGNLVKDMLDKILSKFTIKELLEMIKGNMP